MQSKRVTQDRGERHQVKRLSRMMLECSSKGLFAANSSQLFCEWYRELRVGRHRTYVADDSHV